MQYKQLGKSGLKVSTIGYGCMSLKGTPAENEKLIHQAIEGGINYFDTADIYENGVNEETVGRAIAAKRHDIVLATKVGNQPKANGPGWDWNPTKNYILSAVEASLQRLQTDYIDLYQLHGGTINDDIDDTIAAFEQLQQQGKIRAYGISSIRPNVIRAYVQKSNIASVMMQYSLLDRRPEEECLALLMQHNIGVLARGSVAGGLLVDKPAKPYLNYNSTQVQKAAAVLQSLSGKHHSPAQTAVQYVLAHPAITAAVVGIRTPTQLTDALGVVTVPVLLQSEKQQLDEAIEANQYEQHR